MLTPHEFKRTRAARPRPDLGGDDLADLGTTCWCVGRISTDKHFSIGNAHAVLPKNWFVLAASGRPVWAAVRGGVGVACRTGGRQYWPTPWPSAVVASVRVAGWCTGWRSLPLVSVRRAGGRPVAGVRPWPWWPFSWPLAAFWPSAGPLVRRGPCVARGGPFLGLVCLPCQWVAFRRRLWPVAAGVRCWSLRALCAPSAVAVAVSLAVLAGVLVSVSLRRAVARGPCRWPPVWAAVWRCAGGVIAPCLVGSCAVSVRPCWCPPWRSLAVSVRPCWCAGVRSVAGVRFLPFSLPVAARLGRRWCWCPSLVLAARVGLVLGLADWLAVWALPVAGGGGWRCLRLRWCLPCQ